MFIDLKNRCFKTVFLIFTIFYSINADLGRQQGPVFIYEPPDKVEFLNTKGSTIDCSAHGDPLPSIKWMDENGNFIEEIEHVRLLPKNGSLIFLPISSEKYNQVVHAAIYQCLAKNDHGIIVSRPVHIRAVVTQSYQVQVYDEYVIKDTTAVVRCHIPSFLKDYVSVLSWIRNDNYIIKSSYSGSSRYSVLSNGDLYVRNVKENDSSKSYWCQTRHRLSGETKISSTSGRVIVSGPKNSVPPRIMEQTQEIKVESGSKVELPCAAQGYPPPEYRWYIKKTKIDGSNLAIIHSTEFIHPTSGTLIIKRLTQDMSGTYTCQVNNSVGFQSMDVSLIVTEVFVSYVSPQHQVVDYGQEANLTCSFSGSPLKHLTWLHNGKITKEIELKQTDREHKLYIAKVTRLTVGMYQCIVGNKFRKTQGTSQLLLGDAKPTFVSAFQTKTIYPGPTISLKCLVSGSPTPKIVWKREEHILDETYRYHIEQQSSRSGSVYSMLNISQITAEDSGLYTCQASNRVGRMAYSRRINVYGTPSVQKMSNVTVVSGSDLLLNCRYKGYPIEKIEWFFDGGSIKSSTRHKQFKNGTLKIADVKKSRDDGRYTCSVFAKHGRSDRGNLWVIVQVAPIVKKMNPNIVEEGDRLSLICTISRGDSPLYKKWLKDGQDLPHDLGISVTDTQDFSVLHITSVQSIHQGKYTCIVSNRAGQANSTTTVHVKISPTWVLIPQNAVISENSSVLFHCQASGFPPPKISWISVNNKNFMDDEMRIKSLKNGSLLIQNVSEKDDGEYICVANNSIGQILKKSVQLIVGSPPVVTSRNFKLSTTASRPANFICNVNSTSAVDVFWKRKGALIKENSKYKINEVFQKNYLKSKLSVKKLVSKDGGNYKCVAKNKFGDGSISFYLSILEKPESPKNLRLHQSDVGVYQLSWSKPFDGNAPIINYKIQMRRFPNDWSKINETRVSSMINYKVLKGLRQGSKYSVRIIAFNSLGASEPSAPIVFETLKNGSLIIEYKPSTQPSNTNSKRWSVLLVSVISSSLLLFIVIFCLIFCIRRKLKSQRDIEKDKSSTNATNNESGSLTRATYSGSEHYRKLQEGNRNIEYYENNDKLRRLSSMTSSAISQIDHTNLNPVNINCENESYYDDISPYATFNLNEQAPTLKLDVELKSFKT